MIIEHRSEGLDKRACDRKSSENKLGHAGLLLPAAIPKKLLIKLA